MIDWDNLIAHPRLLNDLYGISRQMRYTAPELLTGYVAWLQANLSEYELTPDECLHLIYNFAPKIDKAEETSLATFLSWPKQIKLRDMWERHIMRCQRGCQQGKYCKYGAYVQHKLASAGTVVEGGAS